MGDDILKHLYDIKEAASAIRQFVQGKEDHLSMFDFKAYQGSAGGG